jgi:hypothetical protein
MPPPVVVIQIDPLLPVPPRHHMVKSSRHLKSQASRYSRRVSRPAPQGQLSIIDACFDPLLIAKHCTRDFPSLGDRHSALPSLASQRKCASEVRKPMPPQARLRKAEIGFGRGSGARPRLRTANLPCPENTRPRVRCLFPFSYSMELCACNYARAFCIFPKFLGPRGKFNSITADSFLPQFHLH